MGWHDPAGWRDDVLTVLRTVELYVDPQLTTGERARLDQARLWLDEAVALAPDQPDGWFDKGLVSLLQAHGKIGQGWPQPIVEIAPNAAAFFLTGRY